MATIRERNGRFYCEVRKKGKRISSTFDTKIQALNWASDLESAIDRKKVINKTLRDAIIKYSEEISPTKKGYRWEMIRINALLRNDLSLSMLDDLSSEDLQHWVNKRETEVSDGTVIREFQLFASILKTARRKWRWFDGEPQKDVYLPKKPPARDRRISQEEIDLVLEHLDWKGDDYYYGTMRHEIALSFLLALETAMRWGEIWGLEWKRIYLNQSYLSLLETKNGTKRDVPLSKRAVELLNLANDGSRQKVFKNNPDSANTMFRRAVKETKIENLRFHDTRHEALTRLARKLDVLDLARMVGHKDPRSLMIYYNATATEIAGRLG